MVSGKAFFAGLLLTLTLSPIVRADTTSQIMFSRYLKTEICIERAVGQGWADKYRIKMVINRWGVSEPTVESMATAPRALQAADARCRRDNEVDSEPRPLR